MLRAERRHELPRGKARRFPAMLAACAALALGLAACGEDGDGDDGGAAGEGGPTKLTVQETAGVPSAFVDFGIEQGFFEERDLDINLMPAQGGATTVPALVSGDVQVGGSNVVSLLLATERGLPLQAIAPGTSGHAEGEDGFGAIIAQKGAGIRRPSDLEGKTIGINTLDNIAELVVKASLDEQGVDTSRIKLTEVPFPEMGPALQAGDIDAAFQIEPFITQNLQEGAQVIDYSYVQTRPNLQVGAYAVTREYAEQNPDVVDRYAEAIAENAEYVTDNPDEFRTFLSEQADIPPKLAEEFTLPVFTEELDAESLELTAELMERYGITKQAPDVSQLVEDGG